MYGLVTCQNNFEIQDPQIPQTGTATSNFARRIINTGQAIEQAWDTFTDTKTGTATFGLGAGLAAKGDG
jgi:hypothetical protein